MFSKLYLWDTVGFYSSTYEVCQQFSKDQGINLSMYTVVCMPRLSTQQQITQNVNQWKKTHNPKACQIEESLVHASREGEGGNGE